MFVRTATQRQRDSEPAPAAEERWSLVVRTGEPFLGLALAALLLRGIRAERSGGGRGG